MRCSCVTRRMSPRRTPVAAKHGPVHERYVAVIPGEPSNVIPRHVLLIVLVSGGYSTGHQFSARALILGKNWVKKKCALRSMDYGIW